MKLRALGSSGLLVSPVCLGTMTFGTPVAEPESIALVHAAIDMGVNFIDTANVYEGYARYLGSSGGVAEAIVGKAIRDRRDRVVLATKVAAPVGSGPQDRGLSAVHILRELDRSLTRLQTDVIDLYIIHWPDKHVPLDVTLRAMETAVQQGKVRYFGASNHSAWQMCEMLWLADRHGLPRVVSSQIPYSMLRRELHNDLAFCAKHGVGVTPYQSLQSGLLTGKYRRGHAPPRDSRAAEKPEWIWKQDDTLFDRLERIDELATASGLTMTALCLAATLMQPAMSSLIVGVKRIEQLREAVDAMEVHVDAEQLAKLDEICPLPWRQPDPIRG
ncbi:MAG: L-glyceraldehyde 3-phosphate reductase [Planctomycetota bacterium]|jgi:aryl-alcohol dehydrogenase-like predicted oxidoreductase